MGLGKWAPDSWGNKPSMCDDGIPPPPGQLLSSLLGGSAGEFGSEKLHIQIM